MKNNSLKKSNRLLTKKDFASLRNRDTAKLFLKTCKIVYKQTESEEARVGFVVSRKVGKANQRNLIKRLIREWFRSSIIKKKPLDIVVIVHPKLKQFGEEEFKKCLMKDLGHFLVKA